MKLFYSKGSCSLNIRILVNELGIDCEYDAVNHADKKTESGHDYYQINPKGSVPALQLDDGSVLTENIVILQYLAERYKATELLPAIGNFQRYRVLEWLSYASSELHKSFSPFFNKALSNEVKQEVFLPVLKNKLNYMNTELADAEYLVSDHFTLPDIYAFVTLRWLGVTHLKLEDWPNVAAFFARIKARPAVAAALEAEGLS